MQISKTNIFNIIKSILMELIQERAFKTLVDPIHEFIIEWFAVPLAGRLPINEHFICELDLKSVRICLKKVLIFFQLKDSYRQSVIVDGNLSHQIIAADSS